MKKIAPVYALLAGIFWGTTGIFSKFLTPYGLTSFQISAARGIVAALVMSAFVLIFKRKSFRASPRQLILFALGGLAIFGTSVCYFTSIRYSGISTAVVLMYTAPVLVMTYSVIFLKERLTVKKILCLIFMILGCALVSGIFSSGKFDPIGILWGIGSGICYTAYNIFAKAEATRGDDSLTATLYHFLIMGIGGIFLLDPSAFAESVNSAPLEISLLIIAVGVVTCVLPYLCFSLSLKYLPVGTASALSIVEPLAATVIAILFFREKPTPASISGIILILIPCILLSLSKDEKK